MNTDVKIRLGVENIGAGGDPMKRMAQDARKASVEVQDMKKGWREAAQELTKSAGSLGKFRETLSGINKDRAFQKLAQDIMLSSKSLDEFSMKMQRAEQRMRQNAAGAKNYKDFLASSGASAAGGGRGALSEMGTAALGRLGIGGGSAAAAGGMGLVLAGYEATNMWRRAGANKAAGITDDVVTKGEAGFFGRGIGAVRDWFSGRGDRERIEDRRLDEMRNRVGRDFMLRGRSDDLADLARAGMAPGYASEFDPIKNLRLQKGGLENEYVTTGDRLNASRREEAQMRIDLRGGKFGFGGVGEEEAHRKILELNKLIEKDQQKILDIQRQRVGVQDQLAAGVKREALDVKDAFSRLNPAQIEDAIRLGGKLRNKEQLSQEEEQVAAGLGVLNPQLRDARMARVDQGNDLARFWASAGTDAQQRVGQRALADMKFDRLEVQVGLDEQKVADILRAGVGDIVKDIKIMVEQQAQNMERFENFQKQFAKKRDNVKENRDD